MVIYQCKFTSLIGRHHAINTRELMIQIQSSDRKVTITSMATVQLDYAGHNYLPRSGQN